MGMGRRCCALDWKIDVTQREAEHNTGRAGAFVGTAGMAESTDRCVFPCEEIYCSVGDLFRRRAAAAKQSVGDDGSACALWC